MGRGAGGDMGIVGTRGEPVGAGMALSKNFLVTGGALLASASDVHSGAPQVESGRVLGPYRVISRIGSGGSASVYRAVRCDGTFEQNVALKVVARHGAWEEHFLREWTALGHLEHPAIVRIYDAGVEDDVLWLAMEYIAGETLDVHFRECGSGWKDRVLAMATVCDAVEYAHQRLIVHGDLKPNNILVDASGLLKLVDFGVSRHLERAGEVRAGFTFAYASPEHVAGTPITTFSDIYQIGLILRGLILDAKACPLPAGVRTLLGRVVARCHDSDAAERYASAGELRRDLRTIAARRVPRSFALPLPLRFGLFLQRQPRRNWWIAAAALVTFAALGWIHHGIAGHSRHTRMAEQARAVEGDFIANLLRMSAGGSLEKEGGTLLQLLDSGSERLLQFYRDQPIKSLTIALALASNFFELDREDRILPLLSALEGQVRAIENEHPDLAARVRLEQARALVMAGQFDEADRLVAQTENLLGRADLSQGSVEAVKLQLIRSRLASARGDRAAAAHHIRAAMADSERHGLTHTRAFVWVLEAQAGHYAQSDQNALAAQLQQRALDSSIELYGDSSPVTFRMERLLVYFRLGLGDTSMELVRRLERQRTLLTQALGADSPELIEVFSLEAYVELNAQRYPAALAAGQKALDLARIHYPADSPRVYSMLQNLGETQLAAGDYANALKNVEEAWTLRSHRVDAKHQTQMAATGLILIARCRLDAGIDSGQFVDYVEQMIQLFQNEGTQIAWLAAEYALCLADRAEQERARDLLRRFAPRTLNVGVFGERAAKINAARDRLEQGRR